MSNHMFHNDSQYTEICQRSSDRQLTYYFIGNSNGKVARCRLCFYRSHFKLAKTSRTPFRARRRHARVEKSNIRVLICKSSVGLCGDPYPEGRRDAPQHDRAISRPSLRMNQHRNNLSLTIRNVEIIQNISINSRTANGKFTAQTFVTTIK